ncbi:MAG: hypothetical protein MSH49_10290 [[Eubacterium] saphenum]|nr:hypothetical protein [[Eubacterium] saphenum]
MPRVQREKARPLRRKISGELPDNSKAEVYLTDEGFGVRILAASHR